MSRSRGRRAFWSVMVLLALAALSCNFRASESPGTEDLQDGPLVVLLAPANGSTVAEGAHIVLQAMADEPRTGVARIELRVDDIPMGEIPAGAGGGESGATSVSGSVPWTARGIRGHLITAEAFRPDGTSLGMSEATVQVVEPPGGRVPEPVTATAVPTATQSDTEPGATATATAGATQMGIPEGSPIARANVSALNLRQGPGTGYPPVGTLALGDALPIVGRSEDGSWWAVAFGGGTAWVFTALTTVEGDTSNVPLVAAP